MTRQKEQEDQTEKNKRGDRKGESNDSPEIPDRRITSDIPGLPSGQKTLSSNKKNRDFCGNKSQENGPLADLKKEKEKNG